MTRADPTRRTACEGTLATVLRRAVTIPAALVLGVAWLALLPVLLVPAILMDLARRQPLPRARCLAYLGLYAAAEVWGMVGCLLLMALPGRGAPELWYALQLAWNRLLYRGGERILGFTTELGGEARVGPGPLIVLVRHASIADSLLPGAFLGAGPGLRVRYVIKRELVWDPCLDLLASRLPNAFVARGGQHTQEDQEVLAALARDLGPCDAIAVFPEGTRFHPEKRASALAAMEEHGSPHLAAARALTHVLPPHPAGLHAMLSAQPAADVLLIRHTGFEGIHTLLDLWRGSLYGRTVRISFLRVPRHGIPEDAGAQADWLYAQWSALDRWVAERGATTRAGSAALPAS